MDAVIDLASELARAGRDDCDGNLRFGGRRFHKLTQRSGVISGYDHAEYFDVVDSLRRHKPHYFAPQKTCPACALDRAAPFMDKAGLTLARCEACGLVYQAPRFRADRLQELYSKQYPLAAAYLSAEQNELDEYKFRYGLRRVIEQGGRLSGILDIGAGNLHFLDVCRRLGGSRLYGIEPGSIPGVPPKDVTIFREFHDRVPDIEELSLVTMWDALEHIHGLVPLVESVFARLAPGGLFLVLVPNLMSLASRLIRERSPSFNVYHLNYFDQHSLTALLTSRGFEVASLETLISEIDNCRNYLEFQEPYMSTPRGEKAFDWLTPDYIHANMLGSRLLALGRKPGRGR
jgi:SAM-dependent methyltransferase